MIPKLNWTKILVYSSALQYKKVQSPIEKFHWSKKLRKTKKNSFNLNIRVQLESVKLFSHVFLGLKIILTMEHYTKLLTIFIWKFAIFWSSQLALWNLGQLAPASFFLLATGSRPPYLRNLCCWLIHVFGKRTPFMIIWQFIALKKALIVYYVKTERVKFYLAWKIM